MKRRWLLCWVQVRPVSRKSTTALAPCCIRVQVNALDILAAQPEGPYLIGGHSYGGAVAAEIALKLESWGHDVALLIIMDTPRPEQVRPG